MSDCLENKGPIVAATFTKPAPQDLRQEIKDNNDFVNVGFA